MYMKQNGVSLDSNVVGFGLFLDIFEDMVDCVEKITKSKYYLTNIFKVVALKSSMTSSVVSFIEVIFVEGCERAHNVEKFACRVLYT